MNKPNENERTWKQTTENIRAFGQALSEANAKPAIAAATQPQPQRTPDKPGHLRHTRAILQQTTADLQTAVDYIGELEQQRDDLQAAAELCAKNLRATQHALKYANEQNKTYKQQRDAAEGEVKHWIGKAVATAKQRDGLLAAVKDMMHDIELFYAKHREPDNKYLRNLKTAIRHIGQADRAAIAAAERRQP